MSAVADAPPTGWGPLFEAQPTDEVIQARDAAGWLLNDVRAHPTAYHADLATVLAEVAEEADLALATRPAVAVARRIGVDLELIKQRLDVAGYIATAPQACGSTGGRAATSAPGARS